VAGDAYTRVVDLTPRLARRARNGILGLLVGLLVGGMGPAGAAPADGGEAQRLVDAAIHDTTQLLGEAQLSQAETAQRLRTLLDRYVDLPRVGRDSLGSYWRRASVEQQAGFLALFESFLAAGYSGSVAKMGTLHFGPTVIVERADGVTVVRTDVQVSGGDVHPVLFMVGQCDDGSYRVVDVVAAAISMSKLLNADFGAVLRNNGGRFEALMDALENKVAATPASDRR
jgi:phospholipid transport system substrate-binding protein